MTEIRLCDRCDYPLGGMLAVTAIKTGTCPSCHHRIWPVLDNTHAAPGAPARPPEPVWTEPPPLPPEIVVRQAQRPFLHATATTREGDLQEIAAKTEMVALAAALPDGISVTVQVSALRREVKWVVQHTPTNEQLASGRLALGPPRSPAADHS